MLYVLGSIIVVLILFIIGVTYSYMQDSKKNAEKQSSLNEQARHIQSLFKEQADKLTNDGLVSPQVRHKYSSLSSNFFVFQTINETNLTFLQSLTDIFSTIMEVISSTPESEELINQIEATAQKIPTQARDFSTNFYANIAPKLLAELLNGVQSLNQETDELEDEEEETESDEGAEDSAPEQEENKA